MKGEGRRGRGKGEGGRGKGEGGRGKDGREGEGGAGRREGEVRMNETYPQSALVESYDFLWHPDISYP